MPEIVGRIWQHACLMMLACLTLTLLTTGCAPEPEIVQYTVNTEVPDVLNNNARMLGAVIPNESDTWFFKLTGDNAAVSEVADVVKEWVRKIEFQDSQPVLDLPEGWTRKPGSMSRFATLEIPAGDPPLELSISRLSQSGTWDEWVSQNVNRWRKQLGLEELSSTYAGAETLNEADEPAVWVDLQGELAGMSMSAGPMQTGLAQPGMGNGLATGTPETPAASDRPIDYEAPDAWRPGRMGSMRWAAFMAGPEDRSIEITVIPAGGDLRGNIERWMGQIRPDGVTSSDVDAVIEQAKDVNVSGIPGQRFLINGTGEPVQAIDATIIPLAEGFSLFIKATGDAETISSESSSIQQFLDSIKLK